LTARRGPQAGLLDGTALGEPRAASCGLEKAVLVWPDQTQHAAKAVRRLNDVCDEDRVAGIARKYLTDCHLDSGDERFGFLTFLIGHVGSPSP
jgi:hypothetical protein